MQSFWLKYAAVVICGMAVAVAAADGEGEFGHGRWRYSPVGLNKNNFRPLSAIDLEYMSLGATSATWTVPADCQLENTEAAGLRTQLVCETAGDKVVRVWRDGDPATTDTFTIRVGNSAAFDWYACLVTPDLLAGAGAGLDARELHARLHTLGTAEATVLRLWIFEYGGAGGPASGSGGSAAEDGGYALAPSEVSRQTTREFQSLGETPVARGRPGGGVKATWEEIDLGMSEADALQFNETGGFWELPVQNAQQLAAGVIELSVVGRNVSVLNRRIEPRALALSVPAFGADLTTAAGGALTTGDELAAAAGTAAAAVNTGAPLRVVAQTCAHNVQVGLWAGLEPHQYFFTQTDFLYTVVRVLDDAALPATLPAPSPTGAALTIVDAALPRGTLLLVTNRGTVVSLDGGLSWRVPAGLPAAGSARAVTRVSSLHSCEYLVDADDALWRINDVALAWRADGGEVFWSRNGGRSFEGLALPAPFDQSNGAANNVTIRGAAAQTSYAWITVLVDEGGAQSRFLTYDYRLRTWAEPGEPFATDGSAVVGFQVAASGTGEVMAWGAEGLFYSANGGVNVRAVPLRSRDAARPAPFLADGEVVTRASTSTDGYLSALTSRGRVFYAVTGVEDEGFEVQSGQPESEATTDLRFDALNRLVVLTPTRQQPFVVTRLVPVLNELVAPHFPAAAHAECAFRARGDDLPGVSYVDIGDAVEVQAEVLPRTDTAAAGGVLGADLRHSLIVSDGALLEYAEREDVVPSSVRNVAGLRQAFTVRERNTPYANFTERVRLATGNTDLRLTPSPNALACNRPSSVGRVRVGCPPGRHIRVAVDGVQSALAQQQQQRCDDEKWHDPAHTYNIPKSRYNADYLRAALAEPSNEDAEVAFNVTRFGCPFRIYHGSDLLPEITLWDGDTLVRNVDTRYVLFDVNGRFDWAHALSASAMEPPCRHPLQTWADTLAADAAGGGDPFTAWGPHNFVDCQEPNGLPGDVGDTSQVFMANHKASVVKWTGDDGLFVFHLRVVDPDFSYCELHVEFAVEVFGAPVSVLVGLLIVFGMTASVILVLVASYFWFSHQQPKE